MLTSDNFVQMDRCLEHICISTRGMLRKNAVVVSRAVNWDCYDYYPLSESDILLINWRAVAVMDRWCW